ncbi:DNA polymerase III subunit delta [Aliiroseovarius sp. PTFE2010]|uniref:DNA polymerase III subunit delta n=1 Tax=Aliiroseovarius sp. PTFE2010 TaxID=3417190 RepID=UPI003CF58248
MKLAARDASRYFAKPDPGKTGLLIFGGDAMRVAMKRQEFLAALLGKSAEEEMRLTRIPAAELRKDGALLLDAIKAQGFFPGPRAAFVEDATDGLADTIKSALAQWREGDAQIVVTAGSLTAKSKLRKAFEEHRNAFSVGLYDDPPSRDDIEAELARAGLTRFARGAMEDLTVLARELSAGDFRQTLEKLALYKWGDDSDVSTQDILNCAPATHEAVIDDLLNVVAESRTDEIGPLMARLEGQGQQPVGLVIGATRHFRQLHAAAADPGGPGQGIGRLRPPVFGPRRDRMVRQAQAWGMYKLEQALQMLTDTDLQLRSGGQTAPQMAVMERTLIRVAMLGRR